jgi:uncharacterized protein (TIGR03086 family)
MAELDMLYRRTVEGWNDLVGRIGPDQWALTTPCADWTVRDLVNHVAGEDLWTVPLVEGQTIEAVGDRFDGDLLGDAPATAALDAAHAALASVGEALPQGGPVHLSYGEERLEEYVTQLAADHLVHGWDLAVAIGADTRLDQDAVAGIAGWFAEREEIYRGAGLIGPRTGTYDDPQDDLVSRFGRDPGWQPA